MEYNLFCGEKVSRLGYGCMRFPTHDGIVDAAETERLVDIAMVNGINYFDNAYVYSGGQPEKIVGKALSKYPRDTWFITNKYPGHMLSKKYDPAETFKVMLDRCGVEYFDFFMLHNVFEKSMEVYTDEALGAVKYFVEQKKLGKIKHLGFSTHANLETLKRFLDMYGEDMEFVQMQLNYLDWTLQDAKEKYEFLTSYGLEVVVMEPVRGGFLANLSPENHARLEKFGGSDSSFSFRFLKDLPNVKVILSGMSTEEQLLDNIKTFSENRPLSEEERRILFEIADTMNSSIPCTGCRYCMNACPLGLEIPNFMKIANEMRVAQTFVATMQLEFLEADKHPSACLNCGACAEMCPQNIEIPEIIAELADKLENGPTWAKTVAEREAAEAKK